MHKLGIIVPYRDRPDHLIIFKKSITNYLKQKGIEFELIIVEQDEAKTFNRGKLLNIGFKHAKRLNCDYVAFHDVDMIPIDVDYSYSPYPIHLSSKFSNSNDTFSRIVFDEYFGGVTLFPTILFEAINGYSNEYWGWGYEDNDLLHRCKQFNINLNRKEISQPSANTAALKFNGHNSYVECKNVIEPTDCYTIFLSFFPNELHCNTETYDDTFSVLSVPGCDLNINFNSYSRYNFEIYDESENINYINSEIKPSYKTTIVATINPDTNEIKMYQDGELVNKKILTNNVYNYRRQTKLYLGAGDPKRDENKKYFQGLISSVAIYNTTLNDAEIKEISNNKFFGLTQNFGEYQSSDNLKLYYDAKFIKSYNLMDLSGNRNDGKIMNCEIVGYQIEDTKPIYIPHRRDCTFKLIQHEENGFVNGSWKNITTRYNQLRYINEVAPGHKNTKDDGLSNLVFKELNKANVRNQTHILVSI
jgi:beta-1,4-galactosyltransferase 1